jgi:hypothetical protein
MVPGFAAVSGALQVFFGLSQPPFFFHVNNIAQLPQCFARFQNVEFSPLTGEDSGEGLLRLRQGQRES